MFYVIFIVVISYYFNFTTKAEIVTSLGNKEDPSDAIVEVKNPRWQVGFGTEDTPVPGKFSKCIRIIKYLEPTKEIEQEIDRKYSIGEETRDKDRHEWNYKDKLGNTILSYLINKNIHMLNDICDNILLNFTEKNEITNERKKEKLANEEGKVTLMQLENENKESMLKQLKENQRKSKPYVIIHTNKLYEPKYCQKFLKTNAVILKNSSILKKDIKPILGEKILEKRDTYHPLVQPSFAKSIRNYRSSFDYITENEIEDDPKNEFISKRKIKRFPTRKYFFKKLIKIPKNYKLKRSPDDYQLYEQNHALNRYAKTVDHPQQYFKTHQRIKHNQNYKVKESEYFSSEFLAPYERKANLGNYSRKESNGTVLNVLKNRKRKNKNKITQTKMKKMKLNELESKCVKKIPSLRRCASRLKKQVEVKKGLTRKKQFPNFNNDEHTYFLSQRNENEFKRLNVDNNKLDANIALKSLNGMINSNLESPISDRMQSFVLNDRSQSNNDFHVVEIAGELTPVYPISCERLCSTTTCKISTSSAAVCTNNTSGKCHIHLSSTTKCLLCENTTTICGGVRACGKQK